MFEIEEVRNHSAKIRVIGVGGAGGNAINNMISSNLKGIDFIAINTDLQVLENGLAPSRLVQSLQKGLVLVRIQRSAGRLHFMTGIPLQRRSQVLIWCLSPQGWVEAQVQEQLLWLHP